MLQQPQQTELSEFQKRQIVAPSDLYSHREIGRQLDIPHSKSVSSFLTRYSDCENHENLHHTGRPYRRTLSDHDHYLIYSAEGDTSQLLAQLHLDTNIASLNKQFDVGYKKQALGNTKQ